nr:MAG TPA: hypothetical protein [Caudoviricetes sp.]
MIIYTISGFTAWILSRSSGCICSGSLRGRFYLCTISRGASDGFICVSFLVPPFLDSVQIVQLLPVYCPCGLVIGVLRLSVCVYAYIIE